MTEETKNDDSVAKSQLRFVSEGAADLDSQKTNEEKAQEKFATEKLQRSRKSLQDQLRANGMRQKKKFMRDVRNREKFNRLSKEELEFFQQEQTNEDIKEKTETSYLNEKEEEFDRKRRNLMRYNAVQAVESTSVRPSNKTEQKPFLGAVVKKKKKKLRIKINEAPKE